jgi:uncharacterized protein (TIGR03032 family)
MDDNASNEKPVEPAAKPPLETSGGLAPWLLRHRASLVFSSHGDSHLYFIGSQNDGPIVYTRAHFPKAMGIACFSQRIYVASQTKIWRLENILKPTELANGRFDRVYVPRNAQVTGFLDTHELGVDQSGRIIFANSKYSCLATPSMTHAFKPVWKPKFISRLAPEDRCHLNGLAMDNGQVRYVTACGTSDIVNGWREHKGGGGVLIDVSNDRLVCEGLSMPHSPRVYGGAIWFLNAGEGYLCRVDPATGARENVAFCPGFLRGLTFVEQYAVVTISELRTGRFRGLKLDAELEKRGAVSWCGVLIIDTHTGNIAEWLRFDGNVKELFEVNVIRDVRCPRGVSPEGGELQDAITIEADSTS